MKTLLNNTSFIILLILFPLFTMSLSPSSLMVEEELRKRIENFNIQPVKVNGEKVHCIKSIPGLYLNSSYEPIWKDKSLREQLIRIINNSDKDGLNPQDYHLKSLVELQSNYPDQNAFEKAGTELLFTDAFLLFTTHLQSGKVNPINLDPEWHVKKEEQDPILLFKKGIQDKNLNEAIEQVMPKSKTYKDLKKGLLHYKMLEKSGGWGTIPDGETIKKENVDNRIPDIRKRISQEFGKKINPETEPELYDEVLFEQVINFQNKYGLKADGAIGKATIATMNIPVENRIDQIKANLERWRWLPLSFSNYYIKVNIADFSLDVIKDGKKERHHKVIVGKPARRTPVFSAEMSYMVLNPTWTIPPGILKNDVLPKVKSNPAYLASKNIRVHGRNGEVIESKNIDWSSSEVRTYTYVQSPGKDNALGAVKFMFPNSFSVYLHDTPSKELFAQEERTFSSGCIRVKDPLDLAAYFLNDDALWNPEKINKVVSSGKTQTIILKKKPKVYLLYFTVYADSVGEIHFRKDVYDRDKKLLSKLKESI